MSAYTKAVVVLPHSLIERHPLLEKDSLVVMVEDRRFFTDFMYHKQKLVLHRASMKAYQQMLERKEYDVLYIEYNKADTLFDILEKKKIQTVHLLDVADHAVQKRMTKEAKSHSINLVIHESPVFLSSRSYLQETLGDHDHYLMNSFYITQRKHLDILMVRGKPAGGQWNYDKLNRQPMPKGLSIPPLKHACPSSNVHLQEARAYVTKHFNSHPGSLDHFVYPITHAQARSMYERFLEQRFAVFGPYQDAIVPDEPFLFHSLLSSSLNSGLITPDEVVSTALQFAKEHKTPINSLEGFIRQIIGWREFVRGIYLIKGEEQRSSNFFNHTKKLSSSFWDATTGLEPIDTTIKKIMSHAYAHHIERLMILGNCMLLCQIEPDDVYQWFMELFIDAYDWVMVPNVYGMSQYADGGLMTTKPYISGSNYIRTMSSYKKGSWCTIWDALYWRFIAKHEKIIAKNHRLGMMAVYLRRLSSEKLDQHIRVAEAFIKQL